VDKLVQEWVVRPEVFERLVWIDFLQWVDWFVLVAECQGYCWLVQHLDKLLVAPRNLRLLESTDLLKGKLVLKKSVD